MWRLLRPQLIPEVLFIYASLRLSQKNLRWIIRQQSQMEKAKSRYSWKMLYILLYCKWNLSALWHQLSNTLSNIYVVKNHITPHCKWIFFTVSNIRIIRNFNLSFGWACLWYYHEWNIHVHITTQKHAQAEQIYTLTSMPRWSSPACKRPIAILPLCSSYSVLDTFTETSNSAWKN